MQHDTFEPGLRAYKRRTVDAELDELTASLAAIVLEGAKGVGKTATALQRVASVWRLDDVAVGAIAAADAARLLRGPSPILLDAWQKMPAMWDLVRCAVNAGAAPGSFLLTGSATPTQAPTHSGADRIVTVRMRPLTLWERAVERPSVSLQTLLSGARPPLQGRTAIGLSDYAQAMVTSGFPGLLHLQGRPLRAQLDSYLRRLVEDDFAVMGHRLRNPAALWRWMQAYAAASSTTASYEKIRDAATSGEADKPAKTTTQPYRDVLERLWIIEPLAAWQPSLNRFGSFASSPKHQFVDPALAARLLGLDATALLNGVTVDARFAAGQPFVGALFEALVTLSVRVAAQQAECVVRHLRTRRGEHAVDLIVVRGDGSVLALEVKLTSTVNDHDVRHLRWLQQQLGDACLDTVIVTTGSEAYRRPDGVAVVPAALLGS